MAELLGDGRRTSKVARDLRLLRVLGAALAATAGSWSGDAATLPRSRLLDRRLSRHGDGRARRARRSTARSRATGGWTPRDLKAYEREARRLVARFRRFVYAFYDPVFFEAFCSEAPFDTIRAAVTTMLAGGVEKRRRSRPGSGSALMFLGVGIDRFRRGSAWGRSPRPPAGA